MQELLPMVLVLGLFFLFMAGGVWLMKYDNRVPVTGIDFSSGRMERRRLKPRSDGTVIWKHNGKPSCRFPLDVNFAYRGVRGPEYTADVTPGQGRIMRLKSSGESIRMPGDRLEALLGAGFLKEIADSSKTDITQVLNRLVIAGSIVAVVAVGGVVAVVGGWV